MTEPTSQRERNAELLTEYRDPKTTFRRKCYLEGVLVVENLPFVKKKAGMFVKRSHVELDIEDVIQAGAIGLLTAIRKDQGKSAFSTYAAWWILSEFQNLAIRAHPVRRPKGAGMPYKNYRMAEAHKAITGEEPTDADLGLPAGSVDAWLQSPVFYPLDDVEMNRTDGKYACNQPLVEDVMGQLEENNELYQALSTLTDDEQELLQKWLDGKKCKPEIIQPVIDKLHLFMVT